MKPRMLFVASRFPFPVDSGGKIRTTQVLRALRGGRFEVTLACPAPDGHLASFPAEIASVCDRLVTWPESRVPGWRKFAALLGRLPVPVATDRSAAGSAVVEAELRRQPDVVVYDFPHATVLGGTGASASVLFTHNVEAEIFARHAEHARHALKRLVWRSQQAKMQRFEGDAVRRFDRVVAVSERDGEMLSRLHGVDTVRVIPTGVDLEQFPLDWPGRRCHAVFTGSMDWLANQDGIRWLAQEVWPLDASLPPLEVVGRAPPAGFRAEVSASGAPFHFTGFVDSVRPWVRDASVFVIPLRIAGGTRLKVFEAMAAGCPIVSTRIGVEGLPVVPGVHYLEADSPRDFAAAVGRLASDAALAQRISSAARELVVSRFSHRVAGQVFESICLEAIEARSARAHA